MGYCKGTCHRYGLGKCVGRKMYKPGVKRCRTCEIYLKWDGVRYPCCGYMLSIKPRVKKHG